jgi:hypothetical protein
MINYITIIVCVLISIISWKILEMYYYTHCIRWSDNVLHCNLDNIDLELGLYNKEKNIN